ncbi:expressed unknown protein [Seminavis robusta]|uniref:Uncharacterized protein n=1 Tax=Seminavis robusta TaxID=568900 RepID=A0A9N8HVX4_9STRA|nr:expressed unknown protein [Seminavis robusta]|eukprot:Sro1883_g303460.1 n/a (92) ;mRNA; f:19141-19562
MLLCARPCSSLAVRPFSALLGCQTEAFDAFREYLPNVETGSIEIARLDRVQETKGNGDGGTLLKDVWTTKIKRPGAPPLCIRTNQNLGVLL